MPTEVKHAIRSDAEWLANQAAMEAIYGVGNYYTSLSAWQNEERRDLVAADEIAVAVCYDDWDQGLDDVIAVSGWTSDATRYPRITVAEGHRHNGKPQSGFSMKADKTWGGVVELNQSHARVEYLDVENTVTSTTNSPDGFRINNGGCLVTNCISKAPGGDGFLTNDGPQTKVRYSFAYDSYIGFNHVNSWSEHWFENCTAYGNNIGFRIGTASTQPGAKNCLGIGNTTDFLGSNWRSSSTNNASQDSTAPGINPITGITDDHFIDAANNDLTLTSNSTLRNSGVDLGLTADIKNLSLTDSNSNTWLPVGAFRGVVEVKHAIRKDSEWVADQANMEAIYGPGNYYTSISGWHSGEQRNLVAVDEIAVAECYNDWSLGLDDYVTIDGSVCDEARSLVIRPAAGHGSDGVIGGGFRLVCTTYNATGINIKDDYVRVENIEVKMTGGQDFGVRAFNKGVVVDGVICSKAYHGSFTAFLWYTTEGTPPLFVNCLAVDQGYVGGSYAGFGSSNWHKGTYLNCTAIDCGKAFRAQSGGPYVVQNCVAHNCTSYFSGGTYHSLCKNNASSIGSTTLPPGSNPITVDIVSGDFVDAANDDYTLTIGSTLISAGADVGLSVDIKQLGYTTATFPVGAYRGIIEVIKTIRSSGGDYATLSEWESTERRDLVVVDEVAVAECYNDWPTGLSDQFIIEDWETDQARKIVIRTPLSERHDGTPESGFFLTNPTAWKYSFEVMGVDCDLIGLDFRPRSLCGGVNFYHSNGLIDSCLIARNGYNYGLSISGTGKTVVVQNCVTLDGESKIGGWGMDLTIQNSTFENLESSGWDSASTATVANCVIMAGGYPSANPGTYTAGSKNNAAYNGSTVTPPGLNPITTDVVSADFLNDTNDDYTLSPTSNLRNAGASIGLTEDIKGVSYTDSNSNTWLPIGAYRGVVEVKHAIRTDSEWLADQANMEAIYGPGNYYTTLSEWHSVEQRDLVAVDEIAVAECYNDWPSGLDDNLEINGSITDATRYLVVRAAPGEGHGGVPEAGFYLKHNPGEFSEVVRVADVYTEFRDVQVVNSGSGNASHGIVGGAANILFENVIATGASGVSSGFAQVSDGPITYRNCLALDSGRDGFATANYDNAYFENCTSVENGRYGFYREGTFGTQPTLTNCLGYGNTTADYYGSFHSNSSYNASSDSTEKGTNPVAGDVVAADFIDTASSDYTLAPISNLRSAGVDAGLTSDIKGVSYTDSGGASWLPVGAYRGVVEVKHAIRTDTEWLADQANMEAIYGVGNYYTSLSDWQVGEQRDLVATDEIALAECYNDWPAGLDDVVLIEGWETDSTRSITVRAAVGHRHNSVSPDSGFYLLCNDWGDKHLEVREDHVHVQGLAFKYTVSSGTCVSSFNTNNLYLEDLLLVNEGNTITGTGIAGPGDQSVVRNCVSRRFGRGFGSGWNENPKYHNNAAIDCNQGFDYNSISQAELKNNIAFGCTTPYMGNASNWAATSSNNASDNASGFIPGTSPYGSDVVAEDFIDTASSDYTLAPISNLRSAGVDVGLTSDIKGVSYTDSGGASWLPVGAYRGVVEITGTVKNSGGDYSSLAAAEAGEQRDLVAADEAAVLAVGTDFPDGAEVNYLIIGSWVTDPTRKVIIRPIVGEEYDLNTDTGASIKIMHGTYGIVPASDHHVDIQDFKFKEGIGYYAIYGHGTAEPFNIRRCYFDRTVAYHGGASTVIENCLFFDDVDTHSSTLFRNGLARNCTFITRNDSGGYGGEMIIRDADCHNVVVYNDHIGGYDHYFNCIGDNNASNDSSAPGANSIQNIASTIFNDYSANDFTPASGSLLIDAGADFSSDFSGDYLGNTRGSVWDIGAFEYFGSGLTSVSNTATLFWELNQSVISTFDTRWDVNQLIQQTFNCQWDLQSSLFVSNTLALYWDAQVYTERSVTVQWDMLQLVGGTTSLQWDMLEAVGHELTFQWDLSGTLLPVLNSLQLQWSLQQKIQQTLMAHWDLLSAIGADTTLVWSLSEKVAQTLQAEWDLLSAVSGDLNLSWDAVSTIGNELYLHWTVDDDLGQYKKKVVVSGHLGPCHLSGVITPQKLN